MRVTKQAPFEAQVLDSSLCRLLRMGGLDQGWLESLSQADWNGVARSATWHTLSPLLYKRLATQPYHELVPAEAMSALRDAYIQYLSRGILRMHTLRRLLSAFQDEGIPVIPLKGAHLAEIVYGDPALRPMSDLDLLFRKPDLSKVCDALGKMGYHPAKAFWIDYQCSVSHELPTFLKTGSSPVEVHWTIILPTLNFNVDVDGLWDRAQPGSIQEIETLLLSPEDLLLHLCIHASTQHLLRSGLRMVYDLAASLEHYQEKLDWGALLIRAEQWNARRAAYLMLFLAVELFGASTPPGFLERLKPEDFDPKISEVAKRLIFMKPDEFAAFSPQLARLLTARGTIARIQYVLSRVFPPPDEMARLYPVLPGSPKLMLYYPVRVKDVLFKHLRSGFKLLRGDPPTLYSAKMAMSRSDQEEWLVEALTERRRGFVP